VANLPDSSGISQKAFNRAMDAYQPFETSPVVAIAISGGRDSMALVLLAHAWVSAKGGRVVAVTVDHGLRPESADEADQVAAWMVEQGIEHHILSWKGEKPKAGIQEAARIARYGLMETFCREQSILHLLLGHHHDDQQETHQIRAARGSGPDGLAAMASVVETRFLRLLRPLLGFTREEITATLEAFGQDWVDDPSNKDQKYARSALRMRGLGEAPHDLGSFRRDREKREDDTAHLLACSTRLDPTGYAEIKVDGLTPQQLKSVLIRAVTTIGGGLYGPRSERMSRLVEGAVNGGAGWRATLGRCVVSLRQGKILVCRENRNLPHHKEIEAGEIVFWDRRFKIKSHKSGRITMLGTEGLAQIKADGLELTGISRAAVVVLPAFWDEKGLLAAPLLGYIRGESGKNPLEIAEMTFTPPHPLLGSGLRLA